MEGCDYAWCDESDTFAEISFPFDTRSYCRAHTRTMLEAWDGDCSVTFFETPPEYMRRLADR